MLVRSNRAVLGACIAVLVAVLTSFQYAHASASNDLANVLSQIRFMGSSDFDSLSKWAKNGTPKPDDAVFQPQKVEVDILNLSGGDRDAVLTWLRGNGRSALYAAGATDSQIGSQRSVDPAPRPTPNPWRNVPLATATLENAPEHGIQILGGFAAAKKDGKSAIACVSFKNVDSRVAKRVVFEFPLSGEGGQTLGTLTLDRTGEFSPNIDIRSYESIEQWQGHGVGPVSSFNQGCIQRDLPTAAMPFLQAQAVGYRVKQVDYADGTSSAAPAPAAQPVPKAT